MKRTLLKSLAFLMLMLPFVACEDNLSEETVELNSSLIKKREVTYSISAFVPDIYGKYHSFLGKLTITYNDKGEVVFVRFTGYYDGKYYNNVCIIFYVEDNTEYGEITIDKEVFVFENLLEELLNSVEE
jgi:hypothetical protein